jgi:hypothetical protein
MFEFTGQSRHLALTASQYPKQGIHYPLSLSTGVLLGH